MVMVAMVFPSIEYKKQCFYDTLLRVVMVSTVKSLVLFTGQFSYVRFFSFSSFFRPTHQVTVRICTETDQVGCEHLFRNSYSCVDDWRWSNGLCVAWESKKINMLVKYLLIHSKSERVCLCVCTLRLLLGAKKLSTALWMFRFWFSLLCVCPFSLAN